MAKKEQLNSGLSLKLFSDTSIKASICALRIIEKKKNSQWTLLELRAHVQYDS